jgi:ABC-2 type transport system ATP-binding protein
LAAATGVAQDFWRQPANGVGFSNVQPSGNLAISHCQGFHIRKRWLRMAQDVVVETRNLTKVYRDFWGRQKKLALNALNLEIYRGESFGLLGPNGSGKTTTIKLLLGLLFPTSGEALVFGEPALNVNKNERIGYLPEESYLYRFLNAEETLDFYGRLFNMRPEIRRQRSDELIEMVGLANDKKRILKEYSKGMRQRIGFAQALINDPELIILDEPTSGLDPLGTAWMKTKIMELRDQGKTVIMCSHRLDDVQKVCDRIAILNEGQLQELGEVSRLLEDTQRMELRANGVPLSDELRRDLEAVIQRHGGKLESFGHPTTTMEDKFLRIVEESKAHPGRRYLPAADRPGEPADLQPADGESATGIKERASPIKEGKPI